GIIVIAIYFQSRNSNFLTAANFVNLIAQMSAVMIIGTGIVFVLLLGEIDLSIGYVSGMGGVIAALLLEPGKGVPTSVAVVLALGTGLAIGLIQGSFVAFLGVPSFVVTLAGLLIWNGVLLQIIGSSGTFVSQRTRFGRHVYSVGGNAEAARRAGINVSGIRLAVFGISGTMAALGGIVLASRLSSVDTSTGGGTILLYSIAAAVIGGTSLFGGRGKVRSAFLGAIVITMIDNGLG